MLLCNGPDPVRRASSSHVATVSSVDGLTLMSLMRVIASWLLTTSQSPSEASIAVSSSAVRSSSWRSGVATTYLQNAQQSLLVYCEAPKISERDQALLPQFANIKQGCESPESKAASVDEFETCNNVRA